MRRPSPAILGSIALHGGVVALALVSWQKKDEPRPLVSSVPVTIVSEMVVPAAPADNPAPEPSPEDGATAPVEVPPSPTPPEPTPTPPAPQPRPTPPAPQPEPKPEPRPQPRPEPAPRPTPRPTPQPAPKRETPPPRPTPQPAPKRETPPARPNPAPATPPAKSYPAPARPNANPPAKSNPAPAPARPQPGLDLDSLAGPPRPTQNRGRPATGQQGSGQASQATGPQLTAIFNQVYDHWVLNCEVPGANNLRIQFELTLSSDGRITKGPTLINGQSSAVFRAAADNAVRALRSAAPFKVPNDFPGGEYRPTFNTERACANR